MWSICDVHLWVEIGLNTQSKKANHRYHQIWYRLLPRTVHPSLTMSNKHWLRESRSAGRQDKDRQEGLEGQGYEQRNSYLGVLIFYFYTIFHCRYDLRVCGGDHVDDRVQLQLLSSVKNILRDRRTRTMVRSFFGIAAFSTSSPSLGWEPWCERASRSPSEETDSRIRIRISTREVSWLLSRWDSEVGRSASSTRDTGSLAQSRRERKQGECPGYTLSSPFPAPVRRSSKWVRIVYAGSCRILEFRTRFRWWGLGRVVESHEERTVLPSVCSFDDAVGKIVAVFHDWCCPPKSGRK